MSKAFEKLQQIDKEIILLEHTSALLQWDQETGMPAMAIEERSDQIALMQGLAHDRMTGAEVGELLEQARSEAGGAGAETVSGDGQATGAEDAALPPEDDPRFFSSAFLRLFGRHYEREVKIPRRLVTELAQTTSRAQAAWIEARRADDFSLFQPHLEKIVALTLEKAEALGYPEQPYDALLDEFEPGMRSSQVEEVFADLKTELAPLVKRITEAQKVDDSFRRRGYPSAGQREFSLKVLRDMGYDFDRGRLDESAHPFTTSLGGNDIRVTTRFHEDDLFSAIFGTIHEGGHGLYELGIDPAYHGSSLGEGTSLGIHESQSRTWENLIGRSLPFWQHHFPDLQRIFPDQLENIDAEGFGRAVNRVQPSLIRIEADEVTYSLHVILRFELELALINRKLEVKDLPQAWNDRMEQLLGIRPPSDADGVLQDVHWSMGAIGYFPTYALGNLFGAQFFNRMQQDLPDVDKRIGAGDLLSIRRWQQEHIHRHGAVYTAPELVRRVTGEALNPRHFIDYLERKFSRLNVL
ncbi:MAG: carboxypeptidase M32 [Spirochaetia bacterium]|nr:carboxypeptidase M32 [Spirochaetia bacterium]